MDRYRKGISSDTKLIKRDKNDGYFVYFVIIASGAVGFAHGGNDVANVTGPIGSIWSFYENGNLDGEFEVPVWIGMIGGFCVALGFWLFGKPVLQTIGENITKLTFKSGFAAQFAASVTVLMCNVIGIPVSSSTVIVGSVAGVGYYQLPRIKSKLKNNNQSIDQSGSALSGSNGKSESNQEENSKKMNQTFVQKICCCDVGVLGSIVITWLITIPANSIITAICYGIFKLIDNSF